MSGKSKIKHEVFRPNYYRAIRAVPRLATDGKTNFIPKPEKRDRGATIANARFCIEDTSVRMHAFTNVRSVTGKQEPEALANADDDDDGNLGDVLDEDYQPGDELKPDATLAQIPGEQGAPPPPSGYYVENMYGTALMDFILAPVRKAFSSHPRIKTYIIVMDKGIFNPRPKTYVQKLRTNNMLKTMERQQIAPIKYEAGEIPEIVAANKILPPWIAVVADRTLYQHAVCQMFDMVVALYRPPPGRRVIIDCLDMAATAPNSLGEWMHSERIHLDDYAKGVVRRARELLVDNPDWWTEARRIGYELAHAGHIESVPMMIETNEAGETYQPILLHNARCRAGEGDIEIHNWFTKMSESEQHKAFEGERRLVGELDQRNLEYYSAQQIREMQDAADVRGPQPIPLADQPSERIAPGDETVNNCTHPNRGLVLTCDTDFLSMTLFWYARFCYKNRTTGLNCLDNAPLFAIGECQVLRTGWLQEPTDFYIKPKKRKRGTDDNGDVAPPPEEPIQAAPISALEVYDVHRLWQLITGCDVAANSTLAHLEKVASFVAFCAMCGNDYLAGIYFVSRTNMFAAYQRLANDPATPPLVRFDNGEKLTAIINPIVYIHFVKSCYYQMLMAARGKANKPTAPVTNMSYNAVARIVAAKFKNVKNHMPSEDVLQLMYERTTWCVNYALHGPQSNTEILDDSVWGWQARTIDKRY